MDKLEQLLCHDVEYFSSCKKQMVGIAYKRRCLNYIPMKTLRDCKVIATVLVNKLNARQKELVILEDFVTVLRQVKEDTYWVFNIKSKDEYQNLLKERTAQVALYKRKIKAMEFRLASIKLSIDSISY